MKGKILSLLIVGIFIVGFFLGSINYDINPRDTEKSYRSLTLVTGDVSVNIGNESLDRSEDTFRWIEFSNLNREDRYLISVSQHSDLDQYIDTYFAFFTNRTSYEIPLAIAKRSVSFFHVGEYLHDNQTYLYHNRTIQIIFYENLTPVDLIRGLPTLADYNLFGTITGFVMGVVGSYLSIKYRKYIRQQVNKSKDFIKFRFKEKKK